MRTVSLMTLSIWWLQENLVYCMVLMHNNKHPSCDRPLHDHDQVPVTPCTLPARRTQRTLFDLQCAREYTQLDYVCDVNKLLSKTEAQVINASLTEHITHLYDPVRGDYRVGLLVLDRLHVPHSDSLWHSANYKCFGKMDMNEVALMTDSVSHYIQSFARVVHQRWFSPFKDKPCKLNVLILVLKCGTDQPAEQHTIVKVHTGSQCSHRGKPLAQKIEKLARKSIVEGKSIYTVVAGLFKPINDELATTWNDGHAPSHDIPTWAARSFIACFVLVAVAMFLEYLIVRRNTGIKRSAASGAMSAAATGSGPSAKTHMMF